MRVPTRDILHTLVQLQPPPLVVEGAVLPEAGTDAVILGWCRAIQSYGELLGEPFPGVQGWPCHRRGTVRKEMYTLSSCSVMSEGPTLARTEKRPSCPDRLRRRGLPLAAGGRPRCFVCRSPRGPPQGPSSRPSAYGCVLEGKCFR